jgi:hypothetical protein
MESGIGDEPLSMSLARALLLVPPFPAAACKAG